MLRFIGFLLLCSSPMAHSGITQPFKMRVMSFNLRYDTPQDGENRWEKRKHMVASAFHRADIVATQEGLLHQLDDLQTSLGKTWTKYSVGRSKGGHENEHCAIWWRTDRYTAVHQNSFWLSPTPSQIGECRYIIIADPQAGRVADSARRCAGQPMLC